MSDSAPSPLTTFVRDVRGVAGLEMALATAMLMSAAAVSFDLYSRHEGCYRERAGGGHHGRLRFARRGPEWRRLDRPRQLPARARNRGPVEYGDRALRVPPAVRGPVARRGASLVR